MSLLTAPTKHVSYLYYAHYNGPTMASPNFNIL